MAKPAENAGMNVSAPVASPVAAPPRRAVDPQLVAVWADQLRGGKAFAGFDRDSLRALLAVAEHLRMPAGAEVIGRSEAAAFFDVVLRGQLEVYLAPAGEDEMVMGTVGAGETVGEMGFFNESRRSASVRARTEVELLRFHYQDLPALFQANPALSQSFMLLLSHRLRDAAQAHLDTLRQQRVLERSQKHLHQFLNLADEQLLGQGIEGLFNRIAKMATLILEADRAALFLVDPASKRLWARVGEGGEAEAIKIPGAAGLADWTFKHNEVLVVNDVYADSRFDPNVDRMTGYQTRNILCGPVRDLNDQILGIVQIINKNKGDFSADDVVLFKAFAQQAAVAIENSRLYFRLLANRRKLAIVLDVANTVSGTLELPSLIRRIIEKTTEVLRCERASFFIYDRDKRELWSFVSQGAELKEIRFPDSVGLGGYAATHDETINANDAYRDPRFHPDIDRQTGFRTREILTVPVHDRRAQVIGVCQAINRDRKEGPFQAEDVELFQAIAGQIGIALENAKLHAQTEDMKDYLHRVQESMAEGLVTLDAGFCLVTANRSAERLLTEVSAAPGAAVLGQPLPAVLGAADHPLVQLVQQVRHTQANQVEFDIALSTREETRIVNASGVPLKDPDGHFAGAVLLLDDTTGEKRLKHHLTRYLSKDIVDRVLADPRLHKLGGLKTKASVLFADVRSFTSMAELFSAEQTMDFLNEFFGAMVQFILREKGFVDKYIGDSMMAVFGVPYAQPDDATRAVRAALGMLEGLQDYNGQRQAKGLPAVRLGIGINTDDIIAGNLGTENRMDFTVIGDGVNISARLEDLTKVYGVDILISEFTWREIQGGVTTLPIDKVRMKGKSQAIEIFAVLGPAGTRLTDDQAFFQDGLNAYRARDFKTALRYFSLGHAQSPLFSLYIDRCVHYLKNPPAETWNGVWGGS